MNWEKDLKMYKETLKIKASEEKIQETILKSQNAFLVAEQEKILTYREFLWTQLKVIKKRWWVFQFLILFVLWTTLTSINNEVYVQKIMGVASTLFIILLIPELWKNRSCDCMEIETVSYYSLKQIYATRMLLFGTVDLLLITMFLGTAFINLHFALLELMIQFLFPLCVTACICFGILCSKYFFNETVAIFSCILWSIIWLSVILNESVYSLIAIPVWCVLFVVAILFLALLVCRILKNCENYLEVPFDEVRTK